MIFMTLLYRFTMICFSLLFFFLFFNFNNLVPFFFKYFTIWSNEKYNFLFVFTKEKGINEILNFVFAASSFNI